MEKDAVKNITIDQVKVSIIMAAYNAERTIEMAIKSVLSQTISNWELIVINDCSTDRTSEIVTSFVSDDSRIRLISNENNRGVSISRKIGMETATGEWIAVLDSDDMWTKEKLEKQLQLAQLHHAELVFSGSAFMDNSGRRIDWILHVPKTIHYKQLLKQNLVSNSSVLVKTELYRQFYVVGDEMHEDFAMWLRITKTGRLAYGIDEPLLIYRIADKSKSSNKIHAAKMNWNTYRYVGLSRIGSIYYMWWYTVNGLLKYRKIKKAKNSLRGQ